MGRGFTTPGGIRFEPAGDPGDYDAEAGGIKFSIVKSTNAGFGIAGYKDRRELTSGIAWHGTRKRCAERADMLLRSHGDA